MLVWGAYTLSRAGEFGAAAYRFSGSHPDVDLAPGLFELAFVGGAIVSMLFAFTFTLLGYFDLRGVQAARVMTWLISCAGLAFVYVTYQETAEPYMFPGDMRTSSLIPMRHLTPWRYSGWYHAITVGFGYVSLASLLLAMVLLALPGSGSHFRAGWAAAHVSP